MPTGTVYELPFIGFKRIAKTGYYGSFLMENLDLIRDMGSIEKLQLTLQSETTSCKLVRACILQNSNFFRHREDNFLCKDVGRCWFLFKYSDSNCCQVANC
jgi:hypothetical protein